MTKEANRPNLTVSRFPIKVALSKRGLIISKSVLVLKYKLTPRRRPVSFGLQAFDQDAVLLAHSAA